jgi:hypothetical protein
MLRNPARTGRRIVIWLAVLVVSTFAGSLGPADAQSARELFKKVAPSVVVIRARGRDVTAGGETGFSETGR